VVLKNSDLKVIRKITKDELTYIIYMGNLKILWFLNKSYVIHLILRIDELSPCFNT
jgi:hypothetical protein